MKGVVWQCHWQFHIEKVYFNSNFSAIAEEQNSSAALTAHLKKKYLSGQGKIAARWVIADHKAHKPRGHCGRFLRKWFFR